MNKWIGIGNLGRDPEVTTTAAGKIVTKFSIGVQDGYGDKKTTTWVSVIAWEKLGETAGNFLHKGSKVLVEGKLVIRSFDGNDGAKKWVTEIVANHLEFLSPKSEPAAAPPSDPAAAFGQDVSDEEAPF
jgi:single-strand DNA-binding protein